jgi:glyoxylase-like metal-dependent hydrolase (beta-lactamase superfamily II)
MYLLIGSARAVLIDTGDIADPNRVPLAKTVMDLLPGPVSSKVPLLIVHTHRHLDHRAGDSQFAHLANVEIVGFDAESVRHYYNFTDWPNGSAEINLGDRAVDVIATPGHNETEVSFYDPKTGLLFSGDFLLPGRLLVDNAKAYLASAERVVAFVQNRPITFVLGGHIETNSAGQLFPWESQYHPQEHVLQMNKDDLLALPAALRSFNGFYTVNGKFTMMNSIHILMAIGVVLVAVVLAITLVLVHHLRRKKRARAVRADVQARLAREAEGRI